MKLHVLIQEDGSDSRWVLGAVDEWTMDDVGVPEDLRVRADAPNTRWAIVEVPDDFLDLPFRVPSVEGEVRHD